MGAVKISFGTLRGPITHFSAVSNSCLILGANVLESAFENYWRAREPLEKYENYSDYRFFLSFKDEVKEIWKDIDRDFRTKLSKNVGLKYWSLKVLCRIFKCLNIKFPYLHIFEKLQTIETNFIILDRNDLITNEIFADFYKRCAVLLLEADIPLEDIIEHEPRFVEPISLSAEKFHLNVVELKKLADVALEEAKFEKAIEFYSNAICTCGGLKMSDVSNDLLFQLYTNRSVAHQKLGDVSSADKNAERANYFSNFKFKVYESPGELSEEILNFFWEQPNSDDLDKYFRLAYYEKGFLSDHRLLL